MLTHGINLALYNISEIPMTTQMQNRFISLIIIAFISTSMISGCAVIEPRLSPNKEKANIYAKDPILPNAVILAESLRVQYANKVENQILLDRAVGLTLIGAAGAVGGLAATGGPTLPVIVTMLGGGVLFGADSFLSSKPQQMIYASGANAIQCALDIMQPMTIAYKSRERLKAYIDGSDKGSQKALESKIADVEQLMIGLRSNKVRSPISVRAETAVQKARVVSEPARKAIGILDGSGAVLRASLSSIELQVTNAIITNSPSVQALATSLGFSLPTIGKPLNIAPVTPIKGNVVNPSDADEDELLIKTQDLEQTVAVIESIIAEVNERASVDKLKTCNINLEQAGLKMTISPSGEIPVPLPKSNVSTTVTIRASGGVLPYGAKWIGRTPPSEQVSLEIESGQGIVTVKVNKDAEEAVYGLIIHDAANGSVDTSIRISSTSDSTTKSVQGTSSKNCIKKAIIENIQQFLNNKIGKKELVEDGCYGKETESAIKLYLKNKIGLKDNEFPEDEIGLIETIKPLLK